MPARKEISREKVKALAARGFSKAHIARSLGCHVQTINYHLKPEEQGPSLRRCPRCHGIEKVSDPHRHEEAA
jgi:1,6-anhydro-N-acetylmuramate kinase